MLSTTIDASMTVLGDSFDGLAIRYIFILKLRSRSNRSSQINQLNINNGSTTLNFRKKMSRLAFTETAYYDSIVSNYLNKISNINFPEKKNILWKFK